MVVAWARGGGGGLRRMGLRGRGTGWGLRGRGCWAGGGGGWCLGRHAPAAHTAPPSPFPPRTLPRRCVAAAVCKLSSARRVPCLAWNPTVSQRALARRRPLRRRAGRQHLARPVEKASATGRTPPQRQRRRRVAATCGGSGSGEEGEWGEQPSGWRGGRRQRRSHPRRGHAHVCPGVRWRAEDAPDHRHRWTRGRS